MILDIPIRIHSEANRREHWGVTNCRKTRQQTAVRACIGARKLPPTPVRVTFTRYGTGTMDTDNMVGGFKHIRDAIATELGCGDSPDDPVEWVYAPQVKTKRTDRPQYWCSVKIEVAE